MDWPSPAFAPMRYQCCLLPGRDPTLSWRQGSISPGTKLEEGKGNAASGNDSSLLRSMMMWSHRAQTYYSQIIDMFLFIFTQQGPTVRWTCSKRKTSSALVT